MGNRFESAVQENDPGKLLGLSAVFMLMTLAVFCLYGLAASAARKVIESMPRAMWRIQRLVVAVFEGLAPELAFSKR